MGSWEALNQIAGLKLLNLIHTPDVHAFFAGHAAQLHAWFNRLADALSFLNKLPAECRVVLRLGVRSREDAVAAAARLRDRLS